HRAADHLRRPSSHPRTRSKWLAGLHPPGYPSAPRAGPKRIPAAIPPEPAVPDSPATNPLPPLPIRAYALAMTGACVAGVACSAAVAAAIGADGRTPTLAAAALALASIATFIPVLFRV